MILLIASVVGVILSPLPGVDAGASTSAAAESEQRWSVVPADESGPDGRRSVEWELDPGDRVEEHLAVRNLGAEEVTFDLTAADGFFTRTGRFDTLADGEASTDAGTWIDVPRQVSVPAGGTVVVPFSIAVPESAEPGDHVAGITAGVRSVASSSDGTSVGVDNRVGVRVSARVTGRLTPAFAIEGLAANYATSWNPVRPGMATVTFDVVNEGNTRLLAAGVVSVGGHSITFPAPGETPQELLPGDSRRLSIPVTGVWPLIAVPATLTMSPEAIAFSGDSPTVPPATSGVLMWALPWPQLVVVVALAMIAFAIFRRRREQQRRLSALLAEARESGRRSALADQSEA